MGAAWIAAVLVRRRVPILVAAALITALASTPALRIRLEAELSSLLPNDAPAAADYAAFLDTFGGFEKVFIIVDADPAAPPGDAPLGELAFALAERLEADPEVRAARAGIEDGDETFFTEQIAPRALLLADDDALGRLSKPAFAAERALALRRALSGPAGAPAAGFIFADPFGLVTDRLLSHATAGRVAIDPLTGAFLSADGDAALIVVTPARSEVDPAGGRALAAAIARCVHEIAESTGTPLRARATGGPLYAAHDEQSIREDLMRVSGGAVLGVGVLLVMVAGGVAIPIAAVLAVLAGLVWTAALTALSLGSVTAIGAGFAAILIGMGDDYVNHLGASYREELLRGRSPWRAMAATLRHTAPGIVVSAITTSGAFAALAFAHFRPLRELGLVVAVGMILMLVAAIAVGAPALVVAMRRSRPSPEPARRPLGWRALAAVVDGCVDLARRWPRCTLATAGVLTLAAVPGLLKLGIDTDPRRLRPEHHPADVAARELISRFGVSMETSTAVAGGRDLAEALDRAAAVAQRLRATLPDTADVSSPSDWLVAGQRLAARRASLAALPLRETADHFESELSKQGFADAAFASSLAIMRGVAAGHLPEPPAPASWPDWIADSIRQDEEGARVAVSVRHPEDLPGWSAGPPASVLQELRDVAPGLVFASVPRVGTELREVALRDLRRLGAIALAVVLAVALISFRGRVGAAALSLVPVALGGAWALGLWGLFGGRLDLFSLAVAPILVGLGDDTGLHVVHRARLVPREGLSGAVSASGRAMVLSTITTCAGFGSLLLSRIPALRHGGLLVAVGLAAMLAATLFVLPAWDAVHRASAPAAGAVHGPHAPRTGRSARWLGWFHVTGGFWYRLHMAWVRFTPPSLTAIAIVPFTIFFWIFLRGIGRAIASNLEPVLGPCGRWERERRAFRTFLEFAWCTTERYQSHAAKARFVWETEGEAHWHELVAKNRGFVMLTAHLGNWEVGSMLPAAREGRTVHLVREEELNAAAQRFVSEMLSRAGANRYVTHFAASDPELGLHLVDALRNGDIVALQGDRPRARGRSISGSLFGQPMPFPAGVPALARAARVALVPVFVLREGLRCYRVIIKPPIEITHEQRREDAEAAIVREFAAHLESAIRRAPHQWFCFGELWPKGRGQTR